MRTFGSVMANCKRIDENCEKRGVLCPVAFIPVYCPLCLGALSESALCPLIIQAHKEYAQSKEISKQMTQGLESGLDAPKTIQNEKDYIDDSIPSDAQRMERYAALLDPEAIAEIERALGYDYKGPTGVRKIE
jgi:hypothetical protein